MVTLHKIEYSNDGTRINFDYSWDKHLSRYFSEERLYAAYGETDLRTLPISIAVIPFLGNVLPMAWYIGFDVFVGEVDEAFYQSMIRVKEKFLHEIKNVNVRAGDLKYGKLVTNNIFSHNVALLFSGGIDSRASLLQHAEENPQLITVHGADILVKDQLQFESLTNMFSSDQDLNRFRRNVITTNMREFYTSRLNGLLEDYDWWGRIQHGMSLICAVAPLAFLHGMSKLYIASSNTDQFRINWGSSKLRDEEIAYAGTKVVHDGNEHSRMTKTKMIVSDAVKRKQQVPVKVCYRSLGKKVNCSGCEKCYRTMLSIVLCGGDPGDFGFIVPTRFYDDVISMLKRGFRSEFEQYFWMEIGSKIDERKAVYGWNHELSQPDKLLHVRDLINTNNSRGVMKLPTATKLRYEMRACFPALYERLLRWIK